MVAVKLNAITVDGTRLEDCADIASLSCLFSLNMMLNEYHVKYPSRNPFSVVKALTQYIDIDFNESIHPMGYFNSWKIIKRRFNEMEKFPDKVFSEI